MSQQLIISDLSADFEQFRSDFEQYLAQKKSWKGNLTTMTGQTLIELVAALGAFDQTKINRAFEDAFAETAISDEAIRACAVMQGIRMTRKLPAEVTVQLTAPRGTIIPVYSQFSCAGYGLFNRDVLQFLTGDGDTSTITCTLYQGDVYTYYINGDGSNLQAWLSEEDSFVVSDQDVLVSINGQSIPVSYSGLWNFRNQPACMDLSTSDGRLLIQFGTNRMNTTRQSSDGIVDDELIEEVTYGTVPSINDIVTITYAVTDGESGNNYVMKDSKVTIDGFSEVEGTAVSNPVYGSNEKSTLTYKNNTASSFGTYGSAVTKSQYSAIVNTYPGVIDAITQAQREINPGNVQYMNVIWVTGVTNQPWDEQKKKEFCDWCQQQSMYSTRFVWVDATKVSRKVSIRCYCYNSAVLSDVVDNVKAAITKLFEPRPGILMTDFYKSDIINCALQADSNISYVLLDEPQSDFIVTQPNAPILAYEIINSGGSLTEQQYNYCVTMVNQDNVESLMDNWVHPIVVDANSQVKLTWSSDVPAIKYRVYGRTTTGMELIAELNSDVLTYKENGSTTPDTGKYNKYQLINIKYNALNVLDELTVNAYYAERQQRIDNSLPYRSVV